MINNQNCFVVNFGNNGEIPLTTLSFQLDIKQNLKQLNFENSNTCYFVIVSGKYVEDMKTVVDIVEEIIKHFHGVKPIAMFILGKFNTIGTIDISSFGNQLPKVVHFLKD